MQRDGPDQVFGAVVVDLGATICQEGLRTVPVVMEVRQLFAQPGFTGYLAALACSQSPKTATKETLHGWRAGQALTGADATDIGFNGIDPGDAALVFGGDP